MRLPYSEYVAGVRREGSALLAAASQGLDAEVGTCPGWDVADLVTHVGLIYRRVATILSLRATSSPDAQQELPQGELLTVFGDLLDELVTQLSDAEATTPVWNWSGDEQVASFWARRMAHESSVHRFDAQVAHAMAEPIASDLAGDGIDEMIDLIIPRVMQRDEVAPPEPGTVTLSSVDDGEWALRITPDGIERLEVSAADATVVSGTTSALLLATAGRIPWDSLEISGDRAPLDGWTKTLRF